MRLIIVVILFRLSSILAFSQEIEKNIFGFATSNTFTYFNVNDTLFSTKVINLAPQLLRFPGGAVGNFYHFGNKGYGFDFTEIDQYHNGKFPRRSRGLEKSRNKNFQDYDYIDDFILLAKQTNAKAVLVANLFANNDDILLMIEKLQLNDIDIVGVELGSELSNRSYFDKGYTIDDYILSAKSCSEKIKEKYPEIKTAIVAAPLGKRIGHRHNVWNNRLKELDFYDAIIIHSYAKVIKGKDEYGKMISEIVESEDNVEAFEIYKNRAVEYLVNEYPNEVKEYNRIFNKSIWVTEWNLQISKTTGNTLLQSLFVANYLLELLSNPDLSPIQLATYHNLGGRDVSGSIFMNNNEEIEIHSTYYPIMMVGKIFKYKIVRIQQEKKDKLFSYKCYDNNGLELLEYQIDWSRNQIILIDKETEENNGLVSKIYLLSDNLFDKAREDGSLTLDTIIENRNKVE
tara:strand:- start:335 stop:1705 length:1371 start_codon:yes stop_codon:yes gene_type:complete